MKISDTMNAIENIQKSKKVTGYSRFKPLQEELLKLRKEKEELLLSHAELLGALNFIVNCTPISGEDAVLNVEGYNKACAAIEKANQLLNK